MSDYSMSHHGTHFSDPGTRIAVVQGGSAGDITVTGITAKDTLQSVFSVDSDATPPTVSDVSDEFSIASDNTINNTGGTDTSGTVLIILYFKGHPNS